MHNSKLEIYFQPCSESYTCFKLMSVCCNPDGTFQKTINQIFSDGFSTCEPLWHLKFSTPKRSDEDEVCYQITCR